MYVSLRDDVVVMANDACIVVIVKTCDSLRLQFSSFVIQDVAWMSDNLLRILLRLLLEQGN